MEFNTEFTFTHSEQEKIQELREKILNCPDLAVGTENVFLTKFLYAARWDATLAFERIRKYYDFKEKHPKWVARHPVEHFREHFLELKAKLVMPRPDKNGRLIAVFKTVDAFDRYPDYIHDIIEMDDLIFESLLLLPDVQKYGVTIIMDISGVTKSFLPSLSPQMARMINAKNEVLPFVERITHLIQKGILMYTASSLVMPFMSKEFRERVIVHDGKNYDKMRDMIGYESLPAEYGGPPSNQLDVNLLYNHLLKHSDYLSKLQTYRKSGDSEL